jgi:hypothetical protein
VADCWFVAGTGFMIIDYTKSTFPDYASLSKVPVAASKAVLAGCLHIVFFIFRGAAWITTKKENQVHNGHEISATFRLPAGYGETA